MNPARILRAMIAGATALVAPAAWAQQPFDLDPSFRTSIDSWYVSSLLPTSDGEVIISGKFKHPGDLDFHTLAKLNADGTKDPQFYYSGLGGGKILPWTQGSVYVSTPHTVRRILPNGHLDTAFNMIDDPLFQPLQGGDYYVYPDGRVLMSGVHTLHDTVRGYLGYYCLIWFSNTGHLDTTAHHRTCAGSLDFFAPLPNGQFIGSGSTGIWDGHQASNIIRFNADGSLDTTFQANVWWGGAYGFLPLPDGRVYVGGEFLIEGQSDTLNLVRFMPDGSLDPTFNNTARYLFHDLLSPSIPPWWGNVRSIYPLPDGKLIVTGNFASIDGQARGGIALIDTAGNLLDDYFSGNGCGGYFLQPNTAFPPVANVRGIGGIMPAPDGSFYIWGAYHGYDDGTTNDTLQRFVSRLYGLNVGIQEQEMAGMGQLQIAPNPSAGQTVFSVGEQVHEGTLTIHDASGRVVLQREWPAGASGYTLEVGALAPGTYVVRLSLGSASAPFSAGAQGSRTGRLVVLP